MKLVRFQNGAETRIGVFLGADIVDVRAALAASAAHRGADVKAAEQRAAERVPFSMRAFLEAGSAAREAAEEALAFADDYGDTSFIGQPLLVPGVGATLLPPVGDPQKIICIGQNYRDHCLEQNQPFPEWPIIFAKFQTALIGPGAPIRLPAISQKVDYEAELAFVIGRRARNVSEAEARSYVAGYMCLNDVSARDIQFGDKQWVRGKTCDTFAPTGPMLVTADEVEDPHALDISLTLNGKQMQRSNTSNLIFGVDYLVRFLSQSITLEPGDIVTTGTPGGVGVFRDPPVFLKPGDEVSITIAGLGTLTNPVVAD